MTSISFHLNAQNRVHYACRLLRKAVRQGAQLMVTGSSETLEQLDHALWNLSATEFLPHCDTHAEKRVLDKSPIVLSTQAQAIPNKPILLNLGDDVPTSFTQFERIIEIVSTDENDKKLARQRWKHYVGLGYTPQQHDLNAGNPA